MLCPCPLRAARPTHSRKHEWYGVNPSATSSESGLCRPSAARLQQCVRISALALRPCPGVRRLFRGALRAGSAPGLWSRTPRCARTSSTSSALTHSVSRPSRTSSANPVHGCIPSIMHLRPPIHDSSQMTSNGIAGKPGNACPDGWIMLAITRTPAESQCGRPDSAARGGGGGESPATLRPIAQNRSTHAASYA